MPGTLLVVLGCKLKSDGSATPELVQRMGAACMAFKRRRGEGKLLFSGGGRLPVKEANIMQTIGERNGIQRSDIYLSPNGNSTLENAVFAQHYVHDADRVVVITSLYHVERTKYIFNKVFEVEVEVAGVKVEGFEAEKVRDRQLLADLKLFESLKI